MKTFLPILTTVAVFCSATHGKAQILITEVYPSGSSSSYTADWFELTNFGSSPVDITGWKIDDNSAAFATAVPFGTEITSIGVGQSIVFLESSAANYAARVVNFNTLWFGGTTSALLIGTYNGSQVGLSSAGDGVNIFDSLGTLITSVSFGATIAGRTLDNPTGAAGTLSDLSTAGVNGAFLSSNGLETGSPGAVPEPSAASLMLLGFSGLLALRRICRNS